MLAEHRGLSWLDPYINLCELFLLSTDSKKWNDSLIYGMFLLQ